MAIRIVPYGAVRCALAVAAALVTIGCGASTPPAGVLAARPSAASPTPNSAENATVSITNVRIFPAVAKPGETLTVEITVQNTSNQTIHSQGPYPRFTYIQGQTADSQKFPGEAGKVRVGVNLDGHTPMLFPYRWGLGEDLAPGGSTTVVGYVKLSHGIQPTHAWAGLIQEPGRVVQDRAGTTLFTVVASNTSTVAGNGAAAVRSYLEFRY